MKLDQLPSTTDYVMEASTPVIVTLAGAIVALIFIGLMIMAIIKDSEPWFLMTVSLAAIVSSIAGMFSLQASSEDLARVRAEAVSQHLDETYGIDVGFTEDGVQPTDLDGLTVHDGGSVYTITVATDGSILLVDEGGKEVPRVDQ